MNINIKLNNLRWRYDVFQIVCLFYRFYKINIGTDIENYLIAVEILNEKVIITEDGKEKTYSYVEDLKEGENIRRALYLYLSVSRKKTLPWGFLVGIRPTKIALSLLSTGLGDEKAIETMSNRYLIDEEKAELLVDVAKKESQFVIDDPKKVSIYVSMPFCPTTCLYCSFASNSVKGKEKLQNNYIKALIQEIKELSCYIKEKGFIVTSVYFGGGTPTAAASKGFRSILENLYNEFIMPFNVQDFTVECGRPDSLNLDKFKAMKEFNVSRISINPQSMNDETLKLIGRAHSSLDIINCIKEARSLDFNNINMDIILGLPGETISMVEKTLNCVREIRPESLTVHGLCIKRGSRLHEAMVLKKKVEFPEDSEVYKMYKAVYGLSKELNMEPYYLYRQKYMLGNMENIGYSIKGKECLYNMNIIEEKETIIGLGADAVTKVVFKDENRIESFQNLKDVPLYIERLEEMINKKKLLLDTL